MIYLYITFRLYIHFRDYIHDLYITFSQGNEKVLSIVSNKPSNKFVNFKETQCMKEIFLGLT